MGFRPHIATEYKVAWQQLPLRSEEFDKIIEGLEAVAEEHGFDEHEPVVLWYDEYCCDAWELSLTTLKKIAEVAPQYKEFCDMLIDNNPEYNEFIRIELF